MTLASIRCVPGSIGAPASAAAFSANGTGPAEDSTIERTGPSRYLRRTGERLRLHARVRDGRRQRAPVEDGLVGARERRAVDLVCARLHGGVDDGARARHAPDRRVDEVRGREADDVLPVSGVARRQRHGRRLDVLRRHACSLDRVDHLSHLGVVPVERSRGGLRLRRHTERERGAVGDGEGRPGADGRDRAHRRARGRGISDRARGAARGGHRQRRRSAERQCSHPGESHVHPPRRHACGLSTSPRRGRVTRPRPLRVARDTGASPSGCAACGA